MLAYVWLSIKFRAFGVTYANFRTCLQISPMGIKEVPWTDPAPSVHYYVKNRCGVNLAGEVIQNNAIDGGRSKTESQP